MFTALENKSIAEINIVKFFIGIHEGLSDIEHERRTEIGIYSVSSCVTRLYAIYERFVETVMSDYLDTLSECINYSALSEGFKSEYRIGISMVLSKLDHSKYSHLSHQNVVEWYYQALTDFPNYKFVNDALIRHDQNLRLNIVEDLLARIQLPNLRGWLANHPVIQDLYPGEDVLYEQFESEVKNFVQLRNDAAHGTLEDIEGASNLLRLCEIVQALIISIGSFMRKSILEYLQESKRVTLLGKVTEAFRNGACVVQLEPLITIEKQTNLFVLTRNHCIMQPIHSLQLNGSSISKVRTKAIGLEIGIKCAIPLKVGSRILAINI